MGSVDADDLPGPVVEVDAVPPDDARTVGGGGLGDARDQGAVHVPVLLRMPITGVVQGLFTLACTILAVNGTRMLLL